MDGAPDGAPARNRETTVGKKAWESFFDRHAPMYNGNCFTRNTAAEVDFIVAELGLAAGAAVLDMGCGTGRHAVELARRGCTVTGVDLSAGMLAEARRAADAAGVRVELIRADAALFVPGRAFDAAVCLCEGAFGLLGAGDDPVDQPLAVLLGIAAALAPGAPCLFTVLNGYAMARRHADADTEKGVFDPLALTETSRMDPVTLRDDPAAPPLRERAFVPTELRLLFRAAGLEVEGLWGGTAGDWGKRSIKLDEMEIMVLARKPARG